MRGLYQTKKECSYCQETNKRPNHSTSGDTLYELDSSSNKKAATFSGVIFLIHSFNEVFLVLPLPPPPPFFFNLCC